MIIDILIILLILFVSFLIGIVITHIDVIIDSFRINPTNTAGVITTKDKSSYKKSINNCKKIVYYPPVKTTND